MPTVFVVKALDVRNATCDIRLGVDVGRLMLGPVFFIEDNSFEGALKKGNDRKSSTIMCFDVGTLKLSDSFHFVLIQI